MADTEQRKRGKQHFAEVTQMDALQPTDDFVARTLDVVFADLWSRPDLTRRERRLISLTAAASGGMLDEVRAHLSGALRSGDLTAKETLEAILHIAHYAGWPKAAGTYAQFRQVCAELDISIPGES